MGEVYRVGGGNGKANLESGIRKTVRWVLDHRGRVVCVQRGAYSDWDAAN